jgi:hypothetical protein
MDSKSVWPLNSLLRQRSQKTESKHMLGTSVGVQVSVKISSIQSMPLSNAFAGIQNGANWYMKTTGAIWCGGSHSQFSMIVPPRK